MTFFRSLPDETRYQAMEGLTLLVRDSARKAALHRAIGEEKNESFQRDLGRSLITAAMRNQGFEEARRSLSELPLSATQRSRVMSDLTAQGLQQNPEEMLEWICSYAMTSGHSNILPQAIQQWAERDYNAAGEWLGSRESSPDRDHAVQAYTSAVSRIDPDAALVWTNEIYDTAKREETQRNLIRQWAVEDKLAATAWLERQGWPLKEWLNQER